MSPFEMSTKCGVNEKSICAVVPNEKLFEHLNN